MSQNKGIWEVCKAAQTTPHEACYLFQTVGAVARLLLHIILVPLPSTIFEPERAYTSRYVIQSQRPSFPARADASRRLLSLTVQIARPRRRPRRVLERR